MAEAVGFIGLGNMGEPFAQHLLDAGYQLHISELRDDVARRWAGLGAAVWQSPKEMADAVETIFLSLPTPDVVRDVALGSRGIVHGSAVKRVVDLSTTGQETAEEVAAALEARGIVLIDAPVSGGVAGAKAATVAVMLACDAEQREFIEPMLSRLGRIFYVGSRPGLGQVAKVLNNLLSAGALILSGEAAAMGVKAGLDPKGMIDVFNSGSGRNSATLDKYVKAILPGTFQTGFTNALMFKDVSLCLKIAEKLELEMPSAQIVRDEWKKAMDHAGPDADFSTIVTMREAAAGVEVRLR